GSRGGLILHPVTGALDDDGFRMMEKAVEDSGGNRAVVIEDGGPLLEGLIGGENDRSAFVALADDLKEQVGAVLVDGEVADLVQEQKIRSQVAFELALEEPALLSGSQIVDDADGTGKENGIILLAGSVTQCNSKMCFA